MDTVTVYCASPVYPHPYIGPRTSVERCKGEALPACTSTIMPEHKAGYWPCLGPEGWRQVEDHRGAVGWLNGEETVISTLGPLPEGWSWDQPPVVEIYEVFPRELPGVAEAV